jgi:NADH:ubiquinone oxidoreductase subunit 2 (subunit N)
VATQRAYTGEGSASDFFLSTTGPAFRSANAVLFYVLTYGLTTIGAFGVVAVVERATGSDRLDSFLGLHKRNPLLAAVLLVCFLSLAGIPPLVGFWAKFNLFAAVLSVSAGPVPFALVALAVALSVVSLYYYLQVLKRASSHDDRAASDCSNCRCSGLLPGAAPGVDREFLPDLVIRLTWCWKVQFYFLVVLIEQAEVILGNLA